MKVVNEWCPYQYGKDFNSTKVDTHIAHEYYFVRGNNGNVVTGYWTRGASDNMTIMVREQTFLHGVQTSYYHVNFKEQNNA